MWTEGTRVPERWCCCLFNQFLRYENGHKSRVQHAGLEDEVWVCFRIHFFCSQLLFQFRQRWWWLVANHGRSANSCVEVNYVFLEHWCGSSTLSWVFLSSVELKAPSRLMFGLSKSLFLSIALLPPPFFFLPACCFDTVAGLWVCMILTVYMYVCVCVWNHRSSLSVELLRGQRQRCREDCLCPHASFTHTPSSFHLFSVPPLGTHLNLFVLCWRAEVFVQGSCVPASDLMTCVCWWLLTGCSLTFSSHFNPD